MPNSKELGNSLCSRVKLKVPDFVTTKAGVNESQWKAGQDGLTSVSGRKSLNPYARTLVEGSPYLSSDFQSGMYQTRLVLVRIDG